MLEKKSFQILSSVLFMAVVFLILLMISFNQIHNEKLQTVQLEETSKIMLLGVLQTAVDDLSILKEDFSKKAMEKLINKKKRYSQLRLLDYSGAELIRFNRYRGNIWETKTANLQNKAHRYYFIKSTELEPDAFYISRFDHNYERGQKIDGELTFRVGTKVDQQVLILNISSDYLQNQSQLFSDHEVVLDEKIDTSIFHGILTGSRFQKISFEGMDFKRALSRKLIWENWQFFIKRDFSSQRNQSILLTVIFFSILLGLILIFQVSQKKDHQLVLLQNTLKNLIFESSIFSLTDAKGSLVSVNKSFEEITGYSQDELIGKNHNIVSSGYHDKSFYEGLWGKLKKGLIWKGRIKNKKKDGSYFWVYSVIAPIFDHKRKIVNFASLSFEVTKEVLAEEKIQNMRNYNIENIGRMSAQMAHQFGTPLAIIQTSSDILKDLMKIQNITDERINSQLEGIDKSIVNITKITRLIKMIGRRSHDKLAKGTTCDLAEVIDAAKQSIVIERRQDSSQIIINGVEEECFVEGHFTLFLQVFVNLFDNSYQATDSANRKIELTKISENEKTLELELTDNGPGIDHAHLDNVFDPYYTTKDMSEGTGLGLSFCREIMEMFNGGIEYISGRDGACFKLIFIKV